LQRLFELRWGARNLREQLDNLLVPIDTRERQQMMLLHGGWFAALLVEYIWHGKTPSESAAVVLGVLLLVGAQAVRAASMRTLGPHSVPLPVSFRGQTIQRSGVYRWCRHPNYWAVVVEFLVLPWLGGCYVVLERRLPVAPGGHGRTGAGPVGG
jgi:methyltransferase